MAVIFACVTCLLVGAVVAIIALFVAGEVQMNRTYSGEMSHHWECPVCHERIDTYVKADLERAIGWHLQRPGHLSEDAWA